MKKLRTAIVGCGKVGHCHARALSNLENSDFVAVCSTSLDRAKAFGKQYGVHAFDSVEEMVEATQVDAVCICTPHPQHAAVAIAALKRGRHVLIEKPLASSLEDCDAILSCAEEHRRTVGVVRQGRFCPSAMRIKRAIDAGRIGRPMIGTSQTSRPLPNRLTTMSGRSKAKKGMLAEWRKADAETFNFPDSLYFYHEQQIDDFLTAVGNDTKPLIDGLDGRKTVELFTAIYRSTRKNAIVKLPL